MEKCQDDVIFSKGQKFCFSDFDIIKKVTTNLNSVVYLGVHKLDKKEYALRVHKKNQIKNNEIFHLYMEADILFNIDCPYIVKIYGAFEDKNLFVFVMEYYKNGDIFDFISSNCNFLFQYHLISKLFGIYRHK